MYVCIVYLQQWISIIYDADIVIIITLIIVISNQL